MTGNPFYGLGIGVLVMMITGCDPANFPFANQNQNPPTNSETVTIVARDVEAPEVFRKTESGRWDGRPTLGGVWVAHTDVSQPERVIIRNTSNGQFVVGALYPRDEDGSAPFQVSAEAALALGIPAGAVQRLDVTALRPESAAEVDPAREAPSTNVGNTPQETTSEGPAPLGLETPTQPEVSTPQPAPDNINLPSKPYVQLGIFSVQANAQATVATLVGKGIPAKIVKMEINGKPFWRVIAGPAKSESEKNRLLQQIKGQGFSDAYFVSG